MTIDDKTAPSGVAPGPDVDPSWRELSAPGDVADALIELFERNGGERYDEVVSQTEHALQCGSFGLASGATAAMTTAAFLHDVGHLLLADAERRAARRGDDLHHEDVGGRFLANWFGDEVVAPVKLHVPAKRYLCATEPAYHDGLSPASVASLVLQGGPMRPGEVDSYQGLPHGEDAAQLRRWDDQAKVAGAPTPGLDVFREVMVEVLQAGRR